MVAYFSHVFTPKYFAANMSREKTTLFLLTFTMQNLYYKNNVYVRRCFVNGFKEGNNVAEIKDLASISSKWTRVTPGRQDDYKLGIQNPRRDWQTQTEASESNYVAGVASAQSKGLFKKGVAAAGSAKWKEKSLSKGPSRFAEGVYSSGNDYQKGFQPYHDAIKAVNLGPRFPRRDPRNLQRVANVVAAITAVKMGK